MASSQQAGPARHGPRRDGAQWISLSAHGHAQADAHSGTAIGSGVGARAMAQDAAGLWWVRRSVQGNCAPAALIPRRNRAHCVRRAAQQRIAKQQLRGGCLAACSVTLWLRHHRV